MKKAIGPEEAAGLIPDGASLMLGGFMGVGMPNRLIDAIIARGTRNLTVIVNDTATPESGIGRLISAGVPSKLIASHIGRNPEAQRQMLAGECEVELVPQGSLVERIRAGGVGLGGILTSTGVGTLIEEGKPTVEIDGKRYIIEKPLRADFAAVHAQQADYVGNLDYFLAATNFNPVMAMAADVVIAEPHHIVPVGAIPPDRVKTPGILVDHLIRRG